ncbi:cysteine-rich repeat secretory protein 1-like [Punica granatum]|uniref:Gnk2-homologous domain-containing protein n=2 Tax=Punica granatum TaxID=22663 RepID=A0A218X026_PUNGR|nr:cysteine-rich repeat secretory protein 1-like [Punica granatum]OWM77682.1 hypothetical protein CDL15_Pgr017082 [Punica granatum]PKI40216.1 hypothetical protein CRG98_039409 [Punica granatum]
MTDISLCLVILLTFLTLKAESTLTLSLYRCSNSSYPNTTLTSYKADLDLILNSLSSNSRVPLGYYNTSSNAVYGSFLCRGDLSPGECEDCAKNATKTIVRLCPRSEWAFLWFDQCMVRYSNRNFFSSMETDPHLDGYNGESTAEPKQFMAVLEKTMGELANKLAAKYLRVEKKYATKEVKINAKETLQTMAQCTPDINVTGCVKKQN